MESLDIWDWKYKIFFVESVEKDVLSFIGKLPFEEQQIYLKLVDFYKDFYSFDVLIDLLNEQVEESAHYLQLALQHIEKALKVPNILKQYYICKIDSSNNISIQHKNILYDLLERIVSNTGYKNTKNIQKVIFGQYYDDIKSDLENIGEITETKQYILEIDDIKVKTEQIIRIISNDKDVINRFGQYYLEEYEILIVDRVGFAEWWDKDLQNSERDLLVLYNNPDALNSLDFEHTIYHEIYPGHGQYYNFARKHADNIRAFDHGAMSLLEGWATFCEWNVYDSNYSRVLRNRAKRFLKFSLNLPNDEAEIMTIYNQYIEMDYTEEQAKNIILYLTQYPGYLESYYLGALCIELMIKKQFIEQPIDLLNYLTNKTWGELFALWV